MPPHTSQPSVRSMPEIKAHESLIRSELLLARAQLQQERDRADRERDRADRLERQVFFTFFTIFQESTSES